jgi:hypothetical protein
MSRILLTNIIVAHDSALLNEIEIECPSRSCEVRLIDFSNSKLEHPFNSNQLAEARQYIAAPPSSITTKFVSFSSYRMPEKTNGQIGHHDMCKLLKHSNTRDVYVPYLILNSFERLLKPTAEAPPYTFDVPPIYEDLSRIWPADFAISSLSPSETRRMPMCNSFMCSLDTYNRFYPFIEKTWTTAGARTNSHMIGNQLGPLSFQIEKLASSLRELLPYGFHNKKICRYMEPTGDAVSQKRFCIFIQNLWGGEKQLTVLLTRPTEN